MPSLSGIGDAIGGAFSAIGKAATTGWGKVILGTAAVAGVAGGVGYALMHLNEGIHQTKRRDQSADTQNQVASDNNTTQRELADKGAALVAKGDVVGGTALLAAAANGITDGAAIGQNRVYDPTTGAYTTTSNTYAQADNTQQATSGHVQEKGITAQQDVAKYQTGAQKEVALDQTGAQQDVANKQTDAQVEITKDGTKAQLEAAKDQTGAMKAVTFDQTAAQLNAANNQVAAQVAAQAGGNVTYANPDGTMSQFVIARDQNGQPLPPGYPQGYPPAYTNNIPSGPVAPQYIAVQNPNGHLQVGTQVPGQTAVQ